MIPLDVKEIANGGVMERLSLEIQKAIVNICDPNTSATAKRKVKMTMTITPNEQRNMADIAVVIDSTLAPAEALTTGIFIGVDATTGEVGASEVLTGEEIGRNPLPHVEVSGKRGKVSNFAGE